MAPSVVGKAHKDKGQRPDSAPRPGLGEHAALPQDPLCSEWVPWACSASPVPSGAACCPQGPGIELTGALGDELRPDGARSSQQPGLQFCSLVRAGFLALTSVLSQPLEKQRKLIAVNDRALRVWPELQARVPRPCPSPGLLPGGVPSPPCMPQSRWLVFV